MTKRGTQLVFIDDSGDPGFTAVSSENFVMTAILVDERVSVMLNRIISDYKGRLGWRDDYEFKFNKIRKDIIIELLKKVEKCDFSVYSVYFKKEEYILKNTNGEMIYNWATKELLSDIPGENLIVRIDGRMDKKYRNRFRTYIRKELNNGKKYKVKDFSPRDSKKDNLIQLADIVAGSINRSMQNDKTDYNLYVKIIRDRIIQNRKLKLIKK